MADNNFKGGPGGRLKKEEEKNTLYVSNPNDKRLQAYKDSSALYNYSELQSKIEGKTPAPQYWGPNSRSGNYSKITPSLEDRIKNYKSDWEDAERTGHSLIPRYKNLSNYTQKQEELFKTTKKLVDTNKNIGYNNNLSSPDISHKKIKPVGYYTGTGINDIYKKPEREVVYREPPPKPKPQIIRPVVRPVERNAPENIEPIQPRQATFPEITQPEIIAPIMRPVSVPESTPMEEPMMEEEVVTERPVVRKPPRAVMPTRQGGWGNQPLLMKLFPKIYER
jgi:hypothetical protein